MGAIAPLSNLTKTCSGSDATSKVAVAHLCQYVAVVSTITATCLLQIPNVCCLASLIKYPSRRDLVRQPDIDENV